MTNGLNLSDFEDYEFEETALPATTTRRGLDFDFTTEMPELPTAPITPLPPATTMTTPASPSNSEFVQGVVSPNKKPSFTDWWGKMEPDRKQALTRGLLATGLNMMALGGRTYDRPVSALGIIGEAGKAGLSQYEDTYDRAQAHRLRKDYLGIAKEGLKLRSDVYKGTALRDMSIESQKAEQNRLKALDKIAKIDYSLAKVAKSNTVLDDNQALEMSRILGRPVSSGSLLDEESRLKYIDSLQKQRKALLPYTRTTRENIGYSAPLSDEEKRNIYRETYGLMKSGGEKAMGLNLNTNTQESTEQPKKEWELYE